ncbi:MAG TPA: hypothetical protein VND45_09985 [Thermoanaerobaculia bacterium]|nr:hypothetical protein [Thermoanaerobaculia bacterium]
MISRLIAALAYAGAAFLFGVALGERGELGIVQHVFAGVIPLSAVIIAIFSKRNRAHVTFTGATMLAGLLLGQHQFARAWDECRTRGHEVRDALLRREGDYPPSLEDLDIDLPCRCGFRPTILRYLSNERGFRLWMTNHREVVNFSSRVSSRAQSRDPLPTSR